MKKMTEVVNIARLRSIVSLAGVLAILFAEVFGVLVNMEISDIPILLHGLMVIFWICYFYWDNRAKKINRTLVNEEAARSYESYMVFELMVNRGYLSIDGNLFIPYIFTEKMINDVLTSFYAGRLYASFLAICPTFGFKISMNDDCKSKEDWICHCMMGTALYLRSDSDEFTVQQFLAGMRERHPEMAKTMKAMINEKSRVID